MPPPPGVTQSKTRPARHAALALYHLQCPIGRGGGRLWATGFGRGAPGPAF